MALNLSITLPPLAPHGMNYMYNIKRSLTLSLLATMFSSILVPMLIALFFFASQHRCRKTPIFWMNVSAVVLGITEGIYLMAIEIQTVLHPPIPRPLLIIWHILCFFTPVFVEIILIFRLSAVYPRQTTSNRLRRLVVGFPIGMKFVRIALITALLVVWMTNSIRAGVPLDSGYMGWSKYPYPKICWGMQLLDNSFCSIAFLARVGMRIWSNDLKGVDRELAAVSRLKAIFFIALFNYAFPAVLGTIHLIFAIIDYNWDGPTWFYMCNYFMIVNNYVTIIGVVFATVWATSREWAGTHSLCSGDINTCFGSVATPTTSGSGATVIGSSKHSYVRNSLLSTATSPLSPMSPVFPVDHYIGYSPSTFKFAPKSPKPVERPLKIHVAKQSYKTYEIEVPEEEESAGHSTPSLTPENSKVG